LNPLSATARIEADYRRYLLSGYAPRTERWRRAFAEALDGNFQLVRGPYLQAAPPFEAGARLADLVQQGVLAPGFKTLDSPALPLSRALHEHQEVAIRKAVGDRRNLVVATGTGSGKTECFLIPILDYLLRERAAGTLGKSGVRALLLYPMNALANDQLRRLRLVLAGAPDITFGRYVGETKDTETQGRAQFRERFPDERLLPNEMLSRERIQATPPHILLTNYAMLEYLLLRPKDSTLFDGETAEQWRFLALDEAHVYDGADGAEVAMLLRRVRDRVVRSEHGRIQYFATSATLGRGRADYPALVSFAKALFDERFEWDEAETARQDVVGPKLKRLVRAPHEYELPRSLYRPLRDALVDGADTSALISLVRQHAPTVAEAMRGDLIPAAALVGLLARDERVSRLQARIEREQGSVTVAEAAELAFGSKADDDFVALIDLAVAARERPDDEPLLPARYHFWVRALEGGYVCLRRDHPVDAPSLLLARHELCPACAGAGRSTRMFELGTCRRCAAEYVVGARSNFSPRIEIAPPHAQLTYLLLAEGSEGLGESDEDEDDEDAEGIVERDERWLCTSCGFLVEAEAAPCECAMAAADDLARVRVVVAALPKGADVLKRCLECSQRANGDIVSRLVTGADAPPAVIATSLYQEIPPSAITERRMHIGEGRQLLVFSDSRQDAAFFAPYFERTYLRAVRRAMMFHAAELAGLDHLRTEDLVGRLVRSAEEAFVLDEDDGPHTNRAKARRWILHELLAIDRRQSLEGTGLLDIRVALPARFAAPAPLIAMGFTPDEAQDLLLMLLDTMRREGALSPLQDVDVRDEEFAPLNRMVFFRREDAEPKNGIKAWLPKKGAGNKRLDLVTKILARKGLATDPLRLLADAWDKSLTDPGGPWGKTVVATAGPRQTGTVHQLNVERFEYVAASATPLRCDHCQQVWWRSIAGVCPGYRCQGTLRPIRSGERSVGDHYAHLYRTLAPIGAEVQEHTAQLTQERGSRIQSDFARGRVNALSCSTTFELGVDLGEIEAVLLRNVPPTPANYVQRAGRAGRRANAAALVITYAQRRSHDLSYFEDPKAMIDGVIAPPRIVNDNATIARRHVHSVAFASFVRDVEPHNTVGSFFDAVPPTAPAVDRFIAWLRARPAHLGEALVRIVPAQAAAGIGLSSWSWVEALVTEDDEDPTRGWLTRAREDVAQTLAALREAESVAAAAADYPRAGRLKGQSATTVNEQLVGYLARRNVLPKYGFPVDVVPLDLTFARDSDARSLELDRDLSLAIRDYAPGAVVVAAKKLWVSRGLRTRAGRQWPSREWALCSACGAYREHVTDQTDECKVCLSSETLLGQRTFVIPVFGFVGDVAGTTPGESRPALKWYSESFFSEYKEGDTTPYVPVQALHIKGAPIRMRVSRQGRITVVNRGPKGRGFRVCDECGYGEPAPLAQSKRGKLGPHSSARRAMSGTCGAPLRTLDLGHQFLTDVVEVQMPTPLAIGAAPSLLYALLEGAAKTSIKRDEIDGTVRPYRRVAGVTYESLVIYDIVPGGAGHAQHIANEITAVFAHALARVRDCDCGEETACYQCLRTYTNQRWHDVLSRGSAARALEAVLEGK
jgi:ATP-dependent helicase YprA (DUF1998 family)